MYFVKLFQPTTPLDTLSVVPPPTLPAPKSILPRQLLILTFNNKERKTNIYTQSLLNIWYKFVNHSQTSYKCIKNTIVHKLQHIYFKINTSGVTWPHLKTNLVKNHANCWFFSITLEFFKNKNLNKIDYLTHTKFVKI